MTETEKRPEETTVPPVPVRPERSKYSHAVAAMIWLVAVLILFQVVAALFLVGMLTLTGNVDEMMDVASLLTDRIDLVFIGNSIGQILFIGLATFFVVSWHTERKRSEERRVG